MTGLAEELALERLAIAELEQESARAWRARQYKRAREIDVELAAARAHVATLEAS